MLDIYQKLFSRKLEDKIRLRGCYEIALLNAETQEVVARRKVDNVVALSGRKYVLQRIASSTPPSDTINAIAVGTSTTAPNITDTLLGSEVLRIAIASFDMGGLSANPPSWSAQAVFGTADANGPIGEAGIFNATGANVETMLSHVTFPSINKTTSNTLAITYTISN